MAKLVWDRIGVRTFDAGLDHGVLYLTDGSGVPWNGLISVKETTPTETDEVAYFDGEKFVGEQFDGDFAADMSAYTFPDEFLEFDGYISPEPGLFIGNQPSKTFSMCYRTYIGSDLLGTGLGYKLHILYNLTAVSQGVSRTTLAETTTPQTFQWNLSSCPEDAEGYRPTAHVILDSRYIDEDLLAAIEELLFGSEDADAHLPSLQELIDFALGFNRVVITDHGDGTWTATGPNDRFSIVGDQFEIFDTNSLDVDADTFVVSSDPLD